MVETYIYKITKFQVFDKMIYFFVGLFITGHLQARLEILGHLDTRCPGNLSGRGKFHRNFLDQKKEDI